MERIKVNTKEELIKVIKQELERQGPDADLNHVDVSEVTDMSALFVTTDAGNVKIDEWDVSNVIDMSGMFLFCYNFNSDISKWNTSKVEYISSLFYFCQNFNSYLS